MYDSSVRTVDDELRALVDNLKMNGLYDNTILVITADHGEAFWEHDKNFHSTPFRPEIHVPLIMRIPGQSPKRISERAQSIDILPTLLDLTGIKIPKYLEGVTLAPLLKDNKIARDEDEHFYSIGHASEAMWNKTWKLIAFQDGQTALFDLYLDPYEENNIAPDHPKIVNQLKAKIAAYKLKRQKKENR
jgi:arylsulfatase A-like enzyme